MDPAFWLRQIRPGVLPIWHKCQIRRTGGAMPDGIRARLPATSLYIRSTSTLDTTWPSAGNYPLSWIDPVPLRGDGLLLDSHAVNAPYA